MPKGKSKKKRASRYDPMRTQAGLQAQLRYGSEENALRQLISDAQNDLLTTARIQRGVGQTARNNLTQARGLIPQMFQGASQGTIDMLNADLIQRQARTSEGEQYALNRATQDYQSNVGKVRSRLTDLAGEKGLYESSVLGDLAAADRKLRHDTNQQNRNFNFQLQKLGLQQEFQAGESAKQRQNARSVARIQQSGKRKQKSAAQWMAPGDQRQTAKDLGQAAAWARKLKQTGYDRHRAAKTLSTGLKLPSFTVPAISDEVLLSVGLDMAYDGHISRNNVRRLHRKGVKVKPLGYATRPKPRRAAGVSGTVRAGTT